jgi:hemerythrin
MFEFFTGEHDKIFMEWSDAYNTGVKTIDDDHRGLFDVVNHYYNSVHRGDAQASLDAILDLLDRYIQEHFTREERLMSEIGYTRLKEHKKRHIDMTKAFRATRMSYHMSPGDFDPDAFLVFLQTWLTQHILIEDKKYIPFIERERKARKEDISSL